MSASQINVGIVGCGNISWAYMPAGKTFRILKMAACADLDLERAKAKATEYEIPRACSVKELLADPEIDVILNLTVPKAHAEVALAALKAGKHIYNEKPLAVTREDARKILDLAKQKGLLVGSAPDTFMGAGIQTCRKLIDDGWIGEPVGAVGFFTSRGVEHWHPDPEFLYQIGAGPMFDMGPYYLTAMVNMLGPARRVSGSARISFPERVITSEPNFGSKLKVNTPTYISGVVDFEAGAVGSLLTSFDVWGRTLPHIEVYGSEGTVRVPDPNTFEGPVLLRKANSKDWMEIPLTFNYGKQSRGVGLADMAYAIRSGRPHRANGELAYHILDIMHAFHDSSNEGRHVDLSSTCIRPAPMAASLPEGLLEE